MLQLVDRELKAEGVDTNHYAALSTIGAFAPLRLTELASALGMPVTTASDVVKRLEGAGQVARKPNPDDGRSILLHLTEAGDAEWRRGWPALVRINEGLRARVDMEAMSDALVELGAAFEATMQGSDHS
jgi:DNA-binding MarR family transcriptional regulator